MTTTLRRTYSFHDAPGPDRARLGGKGAGLVRLAALGLPVPRGFILPTDCGRAYLEHGALPADLVAEVDARIAELEFAAGGRLGEELLVSVRSGAPVSMPGMMDTVLDVGITPATAHRFEASSYERLLHGFATTVRGISPAVVEDALLDLPPDAGIDARCGVLLELLGELPDPRGQVLEAIAAVFRSWESPRAQAYRKHKGIDDDMGTAVVVQEMVFGNRGADSGSGVAFTRDPATGATGLYGDVLFDAQGEDVVAGERDTLALDALGEQLPEVMAELRELLARIEADARDLCDVEFTIEQGRLWILQTRVGQRSGRAAVRLAVAFAHEGAITREEAVARVSDEQLEAARAPIFAAEPPDAAVLARGLAASPGAAVGVATHSCRVAQERAAAGESVILIRPTTAPADLPGVLAATAVVTARGGRTSHAGVGARGLGRPAVCGTGDVDIAEGETVSVDGDRGIVARGALPLAPAEDDPVLATFLGWRADLTA